MMNPIECVVPQKKIGLSEQLIDNREMLYIVHAKALQISNLITTGDSAQNQDVNEPTYCLTSDAEKQSYIIKSLNAVLSDIYDMLS